jgi:hypothetical protein
VAAKHHHINTIFVQILCAFLGNSIKVGCEKNWTKKRLWPDKVRINVTNIFFDSTSKSIYKRESRRLEEMHRAYKIFSQKADVPIKAQTSDN